MVCGDVACICKDCIKDILTVWDDEDKKEPIDITHKMI